MDIPKFLYHYTNIESLALILKYKTIRLNSLNNMDDLQENKTADIENYGQFFYASSWTDESEESIPMWNMYSTYDSGVRIKLKTNPFKYQGTKIEDLQKIKGINLNVTYNSVGNTFLPIDDLFIRGYCSAQAWNGDILKRIIYTQDQELLYPKVCERTEENTTLDNCNIGIYKNLKWEFQKEWRYLMVFLPYNILSNDPHLFGAMIRNIIKGIEKQPFPYYDLPISEEAFSEMEITLSPKISDGNKELILNTIEKYNSSAKIVDSELLGLL